MGNDEIIREVYEVLESRRDNPIDSYTSKIMQDSDKRAEDKILEKISEEAGEVIIASKNDENLIYESVDLIFHTLLLLVYKGVELDDIFEEFTQSSQLVKVKTTNMGSLYRLTYHVTLKDAGKEKEMLDAIRCRNGNLEISLSCQETAPVEL